MRNELKDKQMRQIECIGPLNIFCIMGRGALNMTFTFCQYYTSNRWECQ